MRVAAIHTYPIKGCYRLDHDRWPLEPWGFAGDRRWLVIGPDGDAITQREEPGLTRVRPAVRADGPGLVLRTPGGSEVDVPEPFDGETVDATLWDFTGRTLAAGPAADGWLSTVLGRPVRLVYLADTSQRLVDPERARPTDRVGFADGYPVLLANEASLAMLNDWIAEESGEEPLPMARFRPNLVVSGAEPWAEDGWIGGRLRIGEVWFRVSRPCDRCVVTTTDQETGEKGREPLRTLARHRNVDQRLLFAVNMIPDSTGDIRVGDEIDAG